MTWLQRRWVACFVAVLVYRGGIPYNAALFGDTPVWVHLWYTGHRDGNHPFQSFSFVVTKKGPPLGGVLPKLLGGFFDVLLQARMGGALHPLGLFQICFCGDSPNGHVPGPLQDSWVNQSFEKVAVKSCEVIPVCPDPMPSNGPQRLLPSSCDLQESAPLLGRLGKVFLRKILALEKIKVGARRFLRLLWRRVLQWPSKPIDIAFAERGEQRSPRPPPPQVRPGGVPKGEAKGSVTGSPQAGPGRETRLGEQGLGDGRGEIGPRGEGCERE